MPACIDEYSSVRNWPSDMTPDPEDRAPRRIGLRHQEHRGDQHHGETDRREQQRRHTTHAPLDDDEVEAPDGDHDGGEEGVAAVY